MNVRVVVAALALALAACGPQRVDILEQPPAGYLATTHSDPGEPCTPKLRERTLDELTYHCKARGRRATVDTRNEHVTPDGCFIEYSFSCGAPLR
jgi:hypothetical protein